MLQQGLPIHTVRRPCPQKYTNRFSGHRAASFFKRTLVRTLPYRHLLVNAAHCTNGDGRNEYPHVAFNMHSTVARFPPCSKQKPKCTIKTINKMLYNIYLSNSKQTPVFCPPLPLHAFPSLFPAHHMDILEAPSLTFDLSFASKFVVELRK